MSQRGLFYGWVVLAAAATVIAVAMGALFSLGVFLKPIEDTMRWSRSAISLVALINWFAMGLGSFVWGALSDRIGSRVVAAAGGFVLGLGLVLSSQVATLGQFYVTFGVLVGFAVGAFYAPLTATATKWFTASRGVAVGVVSAGIGLGTFLMAPVSRWLTSLFVWRVAMLLLGDLAWLVVIPLALFIRNAPGDVGAVALGGRSAPQRDYSTAQVLRAPQFWAIALTHFACCAAHSGPIFHMVTHAIEQGVAGMMAATVFGVSGLSSIAGRIGCGLLADRVGAKRTLVAGLALQAVMVGSYLFTREYFGEKVMGTAYGAVFLISTLGMGLGSFAGGWIHDALGTYAWLYISSTAVGVGAMALAFTFRRPGLLAQGALG